MLRETIGAKQTELQGEQGGLTVATQRPSSLRPSKSVDHSGKASDSVTTTTF